MKEILLMVDLDGTLMRGGQAVISESVAELLKPIAIRNRLAINSARHPQGVANALKGALPFAPTIALNGALLCTEDWKRPSKIRAFDLSVVEEVIATSDQHDLVLSIYTDKDWFVTRFDAAVEREAAATGMIPEKFVAAQRLSVLKMTAMGTEKALSALESALLGCTGVGLARSNPCYCEISPAGTNKTTFIPALLFHLGLTRDCVDLHYIGDSHNDIECALFSNCAYTFDTAPAELRSLATRTFPVQTDQELVLALSAILREWKE